ncbi:XRE family transcriptional regulator [Danxiaibacter flavus]|uniref:XRE family transcriptional regulator n=1 Tax=Danxiaibacter flavus TaxID=3049108 RepID=A0ABV3ZLE1_9BACT|nr:XRE family transcriptional regulator [Chitinophagaceae bacterium DXS]
MENNVILQISSRIKEKRKEKKITLQSLAEEAGVTKGLISQIENNRTVPSLTVLLSIIKALHVDLNEFFENLGDRVGADPILISNSEYETIEKEHTVGSYYNRILSFKLNGKLIDIIIYRQEKNAKRSFVSSNAHEFNYMISGSMQYTIEDKMYILHEGDSFYYDARKPHLTTCLSETDYTMLVIYFFDEE